MVYILLADGFEEIEALAVADILRRAEIPVKLIGVNNSDYVTGSHNISVKADCPINEADTNFDLVVLPGGSPGYKNLEKSTAVKEMVDYAAENGKYIAAICAAPSIIGKWGYLKGKKACCYPSYENDLVGSSVCFDDVVCDGQFITSRGAGTAHKFAFKIVEILKDEKLSKKIEKSMIYINERV